ncbi:putative sugar transporter [Pseudomassariella vexata]|uniref:Putative sugar transporter n=1 Tax=Pseudomassariella vexata TaxID=1141098 RepID=A0A1Y2E9I5_9PEZI|nr:putative sugar transporter [Pseudomassariella vexata]ORY68231.1 putative sugar transporter [Pseudomassariella vexata]
MTAVPKAQLSSGWLIALITLVDAMSAIWFGYCQGVFAGVLVSEDFQHLFPQTNDANVSGIVTSCFLLGAFFGAILAFISGDHLGRKKTILLGHTLNLLGATLQFLSWSLPQMIVGRVLNGFGMGITSTMSPVYLAECARSHLRGRLLIIGASSNVSAFCLANWISYGLYFQRGPLQWRFPLAFQLVFPCAIFPVLAFVPESPRWLLLVHRGEEAMRVIARLAGTAVEDPLVTAEYRSIKSTIRLERESRVPVMDVLRHRDKTQNFRRLLLSCGSQLMQQFSGINALGFYLPTLLHESVGFNLQMSRLLTAVSGTLYLGAAFCGLFLIDRVGRRKLMLFGSLTTASCHLIAALCLKAGEDDPSKEKMMANVAVAMFILYHVFFGPTWGGVPWAYSAEINSLGWRTRGAAAATATNWIMGFVVVQFTKIGVNNLRWAFYLIFAVICYSYFPIVYCFYPETSQRKLEDMDEIFIHNPSWFVGGRHELTQRSRPEAFIHAEAARIARGETPPPVEQV